MAADALVSPVCATVFPFERKLHENIAGNKGAAVLDVIFPPYDRERHRDCTYFAVNNHCQAGQQLDNDCDVLWATKE